MVTATLNLEEIIEKILHSGHTWRVTWPTPPPCLKILCLSVIRSWVMSYDVIKSRFQVSRLARRVSGSWPHRWEAISTRLKKAYSSWLESTSCEPSSAKIRWRFLTVGEFPKPKEYKYKFVIINPIPQKPTWVDLHQIWHRVLCADIINC